MSSVTTMGLLALVLGMWSPMVVAVGAYGLKVEQHAQIIYKHPKALSRVAVADPETASVTLTSPKVLLIRGIKPGSTQIRLWDNARSEVPDKVLTIDVEGSAKKLNNALKRAGITQVQASKAGEAVVLNGNPGSLEQHAQAVEIVKQDPDAPVDQTRSDFDSHVQIDIKVVEVSRQNVMRFGLFLGKNGRDNTALAISSPSTLSSITTSDNNIGFRSNSGFLPFLNAFNIALGNKGSGLLGTLSILESNGYAYTLAEPSLSTVSGQTASFLAGGEFPVPIRTGSGSESAVTILYKEYGVRLQLTPTVLDSNRIYLKVSPEVSELDFANAVQTGGVSVPGLRVRRTDTSISLGNGESFVISGMVSRNALNNIDKLPGLGDLPVIGAFFRSKRFDREDKELLMVVTPRLVRPIAADAKLPELPGKALGDYNPSFSEFFLSKDAYPEDKQTGMSR